MYIACRCISNTYFPPTFLTEDGNWSEDIGDAKKSKYWLDHGQLDKNYTYWDERYEDALLIYHKTHLVLNKIRKS